MVRRRSICFLLLLAALQGSAAEAVADTSKDQGITLIPLFYYTPDTRFALGAAGVFYFRTKSSRDSLPKPRLSYVQALADYTQNKQLASGPFGRSSPTTKTICCAVKCATEIFRIDFMALATAAATKTWSATTTTS